VAKTRDALSVEHGPSRRGLQVRRLFTTKGTHPYDELTWERRDAVITNWRDGTTAFEQRDLEFPSTWSQNATNIVAQKYFRGPLGTPQREHSVRQMVDRVAGTVTGWGSADGYFAGDDDAEAFRAELTHLLVNQKAAFNSPVWFNVGVEPDPQCSACFILSVEDTMPSILNWYVEEGMIFKGGSGSGINLSTIRSSKEQLGNGGEASGPVSFMRGADASAGTIKSGGKTRRAAKMVILNVDHPDVRDFIWCKAREEHKARALRDAGFDMDLDGRDAMSIQYQNANNSVRVTDEFMSAYEADDSFDLKAVLDGRAMETVRARDLMREIAQAAWECADPGMQYDTTINDWHTTPESGRINASNPCCFVGDTLIDTDEGLVRFEVLAKRSEAGETLPGARSFDRASGRLVSRPITKAWAVGEARTLVDVQTATGLALRCTPEHRFLTADAGWMEARQLSPGTVLVGSNGTGSRGTDQVIVVTAAKLDGPITVYDLEVDGTHNFVVGADGVSSGVVVHNSEYMHLDNSACNLASLNLLKFLGPDGKFDVVAFKHAVEIVFLAQEIIVGNSSYPTEKITKNAKDFRQLGLGYANLGALLMALGKAYDSDGGRAWAGSITALMTGHAYRTSARVAQVTGPFAGYAKNRDPMLRVMRKHRAAVDEIESSLVQPDLFEAARTAWDEAIEFGEEHGYRNSQATVLAPTGCLTPDTLVTTDRGLVRLGELGDRNGSQWQDLDVTVSTDEGPRRATKFFINGEEPTRRIVTKSGYTIQGTLRHRVKVVDPETGAWVWRQLAEIEPDDVVPLQLGTLVGEPRRVPLPVLDQAYWTGERGVRVPDHVTADLAELVGYYMGDGSLHAKGLRFCVADTDLDVVERLRILGKDLFGVEAAVSQQTGYQEVALHSVRLARWWQASGFAKHLPGEAHVGKGWEPHVPSAILETNDRDVYAAFLRGAFEADGSATASVPSLSTASKRFADELRTVLLALGIPTTTRITYSGWGAKPIHQVRVRNLDFVPVFDTVVGFISARKSRACAAAVSVQSGNRDRIFLPQPVWNELVPAGHRRRGPVQLGLRRFGGVTRALAAEIHRETADPRLGAALGYAFERVAANEDGGMQPTYDLSVPDNVTYVADGFVSHNTIGLLMDCDTTGIEPDLALVKTKKLVGGGSMSIVNQTVPRALRTLGYAEEHVQAVAEYVAEHNSVKGAPALREEHYEVFDCAMGDSPIHYMGHIRMMAAAQTGISGAISKTVNMPEHVTVEEVEHAYVEGWKLGLKALAIYRDNCKVGQPLSADRKVTTDTGAVIEVDHAPVRRRLPKQRPSRTTSFRVGDIEGYLTAGSYPDDGLGEIFVKVSKQGSTLSGVMDAFAIAVSVGLQYGVPLEALVAKFTNMIFEPNGMTDDKDVRIAQSLVDYLARRLAIDYLDVETRQALGIKTTAERTAEVNGTAEAPAPPAAPVEGATPAAEADAGRDSTAGVDGASGQAPAQRPAPAATSGLAFTPGTAAVDAPYCSTCGVRMRPAGSCFVCESCGTTSGCS
jgi:ribonucleoside-diphosphate reductase alpha chain